MAHYDNNTHCHSRGHHLSSAWRIVPCHCSLSLPLLEWLSFSMTTSPQLNVVLLNNHFNFLSSSPSCHLKCRAGINTYHGNLPIDVVTSSLILNWIISFLIATHICMLLSIHNIHQLFMNSEDCIRCTYLPGVDVPYSRQMTIRLLLSPFIVPITSPASTKSIQPAHVASSTETYRCL